MKLFTRLFLSVTILVLLIMLGVVYTVLTREREIFEEEARKKGETIAKLLAMSSINFLLTNDYSTMKRFTETITMDEDITYVMILDPSGLVKMHSNVGLIGESIDDLSAPVSAGGGNDIGGRYRLLGSEEVYDISEPIITADRELGRVRLGISTKKMQQEIVKSRNQILFMGVLAVLAGMVGSMLVGKSVSRPINRLMHSAKAISRGDLEVELEVTSSDEIGVLTAAFRDMAEALKRNINELIRAEQLMIMGKMAAGLAHEIKNPLEAIKGSAAYLEGKYSGDITIAKFTRIIKEEIQAVVELIDEHLRYARPAKPRFALRDINEVILEALQLAENLLDQNRIRLHKELAAGLPAVYADSGQIKQVVMNLVLNAAEAMPTGGDLSIRTAWAGDGSAGHGTSHASEGVEIQIADSGKGMTDEQLKRIFDPFFTTKEKGSGLGLSISARIVETHRGNIRVESREGAGSVFRIFLPASGKGFGGWE